MSALLAIGAGLLCVLLVLAILRQLLKLAVFAFVAAVLLLGVWYLVRDHAPEPVAEAMREAVDDVRTEVGKASEVASKRLHEEAERLKAEAEKRAAAEAAREAAAAEAKAAPSEASKSTPR